VTPILHFKSGDNKITKLFQIMFHRTHCIEYSIPQCAFVIQSEIPSNRIIDIMLTEYSRGQLIYTGKYQTSQNSLRGDSLDYN